MAITIKEIRDLKKYYKDELYGLVRKEQKIDQAYIDDTFDAGVKKPHRVFRSGIGRKMVDAPAEQIVTLNPQAFIETKNKEMGARISKAINDWIDILRRQNPNPFKESVKNKLGRGENYIYVCHNEDWVTSLKNEKGKEIKSKDGKPIFIRDGLPVHFMVLDPMVIYGSPEEDENGIPKKVIVFYERQPQDVIVGYPDWGNPNKAGEGRNKKKKVEWLEYWDKGIRYFEGDEGFALKGGIQKNVYGFPPFVRKYTGFGKRSPDGELSHLIVSDIRFTRSLIAEECMLRSDIASIIHLFGHKPRTLVVPEGTDIEKLREALSFGAYDINIVPEGTKFVDDISPSVPVEMLQRLADVRAEIAQRCPFIMAGFPMGMGGRQQGMTDVAAMRRYDTVIENTESEWATAFEMAFKIMKAIPTLLPEGLLEADLNVAFKCTVKLKAKDPIEEDRLITLGDRLRRLPNPGIDLETFHTEFMGYTQYKSKEIMAKMLADMVTIYNPDVAEIMGMVAAEEAGMERWLEQVRQRRQMLQRQQGGLGQVPPPTTQERVQGEVETPLGREMGTEGTRGARIPPRRYYREGM